MGDLRENGRGLSTVLFILFLCFLNLLASSHRLLERENKTMKKKKKAKNKTKEKFKKKKKKKKKKKEEKEEVCLFVA